MIPSGGRSKSPIKASSNFSDLLRIEETDVEPVLGHSGSGSVFIEPPRKVLATRVEWVEREKSESHADYFTKASRGKGALGLAVCGLSIGRRSKLNAKDQVLHVDHPWLACFLGHGRSRRRRRSSQGMAHFLATAQDFMLEPALYLVFRSFLRGVMEHITVAIPDSDDDHMKDVARHTQIAKRERSPTPPGSIEQELSPDAALDALIARRNQRSDASEVIPTWFDDFSRRLEGKIGSQLSLMTDAFKGFQSTVGGLDARLAALEQKQPADNNDPRVDQLIQQVADLQQKLLQEGQPS